MGTDRGSRLVRIRGLADRVRVRITAVAVLVVGIALLVAAATLVIALRGVLTEELANTARVRAAELAADVEAGAPADRLFVDDLADEFVQLLDASGKVAASTANVAGRPPLARPASDDAVEIVGPAAEFPMIAAAADGATPQRRFTVVVALSLEPVTEVTALITRMLLVGATVLLLVIAGTAWYLVGRALAPVEAIREEVDEISTSELHRRVPDPGTDDELGRLARTMNRMLDRVEKGHQRQRQFVSDASHELRTPVAVIRQHAEVVLAHPGRASAPDLAATVLAEDLRIERLIEDLLLLARTDEHSLHLRPVAVDLDDVVFAEAGRLRATTALRIDTAEVSAGQIRGDEEALRRVLRNLGENAARYARSHVAFRLVETDGHVDLTVDDDGPGIPAADRLRVLERFVRLDAARARDAGGSGLGLAIVAELVERHGGILEITTGAAGGARVQLRFPRLPEQG